MYITNFNLKKKLGINRLMEADSGADGGVDIQDTNPNGKGTEADAQESKEEEKTFTQGEVDKMIKDRIAREKKGQLSKEELQAYAEWKENQKTDAEKQSEALSNAEKSKQAAEERAVLAETKVICLSKGVNSTSVDDVVILAKSIVTDEINIDKAIDKILEKYPSFKGEQQEEQKGFKVGADKGKENSNALNDALSRAFGNNKN